MDGAANAPNIGGGCGVGDSGGGDSVDVGGGDGGGVEPSVIDGERGTKAGV